MQYQIKRSYFQNSLKFQCCMRNNLRSVRLSIKVYCEADKNKKVEGHEHWQETYKKTYQFQ